MVGVALRMACTPASLLLQPTLASCCAAERLDGGLAALETMGLVLGRALYEGGCCLWVGRYMFFCMHVEGHLLSSCVS